MLQYSNFAVLTSDTANNISKRLRFLTNKPHTFAGLFDTALHLLPIFHWLMLNSEGSARRNVGLTPLALAKELGHQHIVDYLSQCDRPDLEVTWWSAMHEAVFHGSSVMTNILINTEGNAPSLKCRARLDGTLLHIAWSVNRWAVVNYLLEHPEGPDPTVKSSRRETVFFQEKLCYANLQRLIWLKDARINWKSKNRDGKNILHIAAEAENTNCMRLLLDLPAEIRPDLYAYDAYGKDIWDYSKNRPQLKLFLHSLPEEQRIPFFPRRSPASAAASQGSQQLVALASLASLSLQEDFGEVGPVVEEEAPASAAALPNLGERDDFDAQKDNLDFAILSSPEANKRFYSNFAVLPTAEANCISQKFSSVVNKNVTFQRLFEMTAKSGRTSPFDWLMLNSAGAVRQDAGVTPLQLAKLLGEDKIARFLSASNLPEILAVKWWSAMHEAVFHGCMDLVIILMNINRDAPSLKFVNKYGSTLLHHSWHNELWGVTKYLLEHPEGPDPNTRNSGGRLFFQEKLNLSLLKKLIELGDGRINWKSKDMSGRNILNIAAEAGNCECIHLILSLPADIRPDLYNYDAYGRNIYDYAKQNPMLHQFLPLLVATPHHARILTVESQDLRVEEASAPAASRSVQEQWENWEVVEEGTAVETNASVAAPQSGIHQKYLGGVLPTLPAPHKPKMPNKIYSQQYALAPITDGTAGKIQRKSFDINLGVMEAIFHTHGGMLSESDTVTFVLAGRVENALLPVPKKGKCVAVLTESEYLRVKGQLNTAIDVLVIKKLRSATHGEYANLHLATPRRLAILLFAHVMDLPHFLMVDDNIQTVKFNMDEAIPSWDGFYQLLVSHLSNLGILSVKTESIKKIYNGYLGCKLFMVNMRKIREKLPEIRDMFMLLPNAAQAQKGCEDFYLQIFIYQMLKMENQGYRVLDDQVACLIRAKRHHNACVSAGVKVAIYDQPSESDLTKLPEERRNWLIGTIHVLNGIINKNLSLYQAQAERLALADLHLHHARAHGLEAEFVAQQAITDHFSFMEKLTGFMGALELNPRAYRPFQMKALKAATEISEKVCRLKIATGCGKTIIQIDLARAAYHCALPGEYIVIVTPYLNLVKQFYQDFLRRNQTNPLLGVNDLRIPPQDVITISSEADSVKLPTLLANTRVKDQKTIMIFCERSFAKLLEHDKDFMGKVKLLLLDEYAEYEYVLPKVLGEVERLDDICAIGSTATPPTVDPMASQTLYQYTRSEGVRDGILAPVICDEFGVDFSEENVAALIEALPGIIRRQHHPRFGSISTLAEAKGLVYLPSIEACDRAKAVLDAHGIPCHAIHSKNNTQKNELEEFLDSESPSVLLACNMLGVGFDHSKLGWIIIGRNINQNNPDYMSLVEQWIGRVMRIDLDKIGFVLGFNNVIREIVEPLLRNSHEGLLPSWEYVNQRNRFLLGESRWQTYVEKEKENDHRPVPSITQRWDQQQVKKKPNLRNLPDAVHIMHRLTR